MASALSGNIVKTQVKKLLLDDKNPRLDPEERYSQQSLLKTFEEDYNLLPIARSIVDNGFFIDEPLLIVPDPKGTGKYVVIEGNRRLATVKFLTEDEALELSTERSKWQALRKEMALKGLDLSEVPTIIYSKREDLDAVLAFKHVSGILKWDALQKTRYINDYVERRKYAITFEELADDTGTRKWSVTNYFVAYRAYLQLKSKDVNLEALEDDFSLFYTALNRTNIRSFLEIDTENKGPEALRSPIPEEKVDNAVEIVNYLFGTRETEPIIGESRDIAYLNEVVANENALNYLRKTRDLAHALLLCENVEDLMVDSLEKASENLDTVLQFLQGGGRLLGIYKPFIECSSKLAKISKILAKEKS